jgi:hypothetical protein
MGRQRFLTDLALAEYLSWSFGEKAEAWCNRCGWYSEKHYTERIEPLRAAHARYHREHPYNGRPE